MLLPILPAILLFKLLPSTADVSGPFQGLQIKLGGAVAVYFLLVLIISFGPRPTPPYEVWTVKGYILDEAGQPLPADKVNMNIQPRSVEYLNDGSFEMDILVKRNQSGQVKLPTLNVEWQPAQLFGNATVHLDTAGQLFGKKYDMKSSSSSREITIVEPIKLQKKIEETAYKPANTTPQPTALPSKLADPSPTSTPSS